MILLDFTNNETIEFPSLFEAQMFIWDLALHGIFVSGIHCSDAEDIQSLEDYILGLYQSIN
tara:strand:- start:250 stop:432 length:183 start_codon:yes stop_codon:yes gene_type:complete